jgi:hypothetical protein
MLYLGHRAEEPLEHRVLCRISQLIVPRIAPEGATAQAGAGIRRHATAVWSAKAPSHELPAPSVSHLVAERHPLKLCPNRKQEAESHLWDVSKNTPGQTSSACPTLRDLHKARTRLLMHILLAPSISRGSVELRLLSPKGVIAIIALKAGGLYHTDS